MGARTAAMIGGGVWNLFRFAVITLVFLRHTIGDSFAHLNILWAGAPTLLVVVIYGACAFLPDTCRRYVPLLRIGTLLMALTDAMVVLTASYLPAAERLGAGEDPFLRLLFVVVAGVLVVDLLIFAALISYRPMDTWHSAPDARDDRPDYHETDVEDT